MTEAKQAKDKMRSRRNNLAHSGPTPGRMRSIRTHGKAECADHASGRAASLPEAPKHKQHVRRRREDAGVRPGAARTGKRGSTRVRTVVPGAGGVTVGLSLLAYKLATRSFLIREIKLLAKLLKEITSKAKR